LHSAESDEEFEDEELSLELEEEELPDEPSFELFGSWVTGFLID